MPQDNSDSLSVSTQDLIIDEELVNPADIYKDTVFPSLLTRVKALLIDLIIILIIFSMASVLIYEIGEPPNWVRGLIFIFSIYLYEPLFITFSGGTIGHHILKMTVRKEKNPEKKLNIFKASLRFLIKYLLGWLSFITITGNKRKQAIHDMASGSIVLYKN